jgi:hypothetical protein
VTRGALTPASTVNRSRSAATRLRRTQQLREPRVEGRQLGFAQPVSAIGASCSAARFIASKLAASA